MKQKEYSRKYYLANRDAILAKIKKHYVANRETILVQHKQWREANCPAGSACQSYMAMIQRCNNPNATITTYTAVGV